MLALNWWPSTFLRFHPKPGIINKHTHTSFASTFSFWLYCHRRPICLKWSIEPLMCLGQWGRSQSLAETFRETSRKSEKNWLPFPITFLWIKRWLAFPLFNCNIINTYCKLLSVLATFLSYCDQMRGKKQSEAGKLYFWLVVWKYMIHNGRKGMAQVYTWQQEPTTGTLYILLS